MNETRSLLCSACVLLLVACGGGGGSGPPPVTVTVTPSAASVMLTQQIQLTATTTNATAPVTWSSSNTALATVDSTGLVTSLPVNQVTGPIVGQVTITATSGGASGTATISITLGIAFSNVSAGRNHTCGVGGVQSSGTYDVAYCWGDNSAGQLGNGTTTNSSTPVQVSGGLRFSSVSAGGNQTCGVASFDPASQSGGAVYCWGDNSSGQLGNGTTTNSTTPTLVAGGLVFPSVSVGGKHVCGVPGGGASAYCWGDNSFGQLGNGTMTNSSVPVPVPTGYILSGDPRFYDFIGFVSAGSSHTCGVAEGGSGFINWSAAVCWGDNSSGQLGNGTTTNSATPVALGDSSHTNFANFSAATLFTCAFNYQGIASCWGNNGVGQLGDGTTSNSTTPVPISGNPNFTSISAGGMHACASSNNVGPSTYCWGDNSSGQLGNGAMTNSATPVAVVGNLNRGGLSAGGSHTCGEASGGAVYCWGDNTYGQLGNSWTTSSSVPVNVAGPP